MASLDDFFAKKDKKKSKTTKKITDEKIENETSGKSKTGSGADGNSDDEWKQFEEVNKDLTGLKIQQVDDTKATNNENANSENENVENVKDGKSAAWKPIATTPATANISSDSNKTEGAKSSDKPGAYIAPGRKMELMSNKPKMPLDVNNELMFPTLQTATQPSAKPVIKNAWKTPAPVSAPPTSAAAAVSKPVAPEVATEQSGPKENKYVPPHLRNK